MDKIGLILITIIWGIAFVVQKNASLMITPMPFNFARFLIASLAIYSILKFRRIDLKKGNKEGLILGCLLAIGTNLQQLGISLTGSGRSGFITGLYVMFVPVILYLWKGRVATLAEKGSVVLALLGLYLLNHKLSGGNIYGDLAVFLCAFVFAFHFIFVEGYIKEVHALVLAFKQFLFCALFSLFGALIFEAEGLKQISIAYKEILYGGLISISIGYTGQLYFQKRVNPTTCAIILSLESVFAALFGWYFLNEKMDMIELSGCMSLFIAALIPIF